MLLNRCFIRTTDLGSFEQHLLFPHQRTSLSYLRAEGALQARRKLQPSRRLKAFVRSKAVVGALATPAGSPAALAQNLEDGGVIIVGAGIGGLAAANALRLVGIPVVVLERGPALPLTGITIGLWPNAIKALDALGVGEDFHKIPTVERMTIFDKKGAVLMRQPLSEDGPRLVRRAALVSSLAAALPVDTIRCNSAVESVSQDTHDRRGDETFGRSAGVEVELEGGVRMRARMLVGADGAKSVVGSHLGLPPPSYNGYVVYRGIAHFPQGTPHDLLARRDMVQVWGQGVRVGALAVDDCHMYWFVGQNAREADLVPKTSVEYKHDVLCAVSGMAWGIAEAIRATPDDGVLRNRIGDRWMRPGQKAGKGTITLVGDSFHPMSPNLAQGGCTALEDAVVLGQHLKRAMTARESDPKEGLAGVETAELTSVLREYEDQRMRRVFPVQLKSYVAGAVAQLAFPPLIVARDFLAPWLINPANARSVTGFDVGNLA